MTTSLFLVSHKAHGQATFDVAERMDCPECRDKEHNAIGEYIGAPGCDECDGLGYWWITSTGGWRVYPWWSTEIRTNETDIWFSDNYVSVVYPNVLPMPPSARELYNPLARDPSPQAPSTLLASLGLGKSKAEPIKRRI